VVLCYTCNSWGPVTACLSLFVFMPCVSAAPKHKWLKFICWFSQPLTKDNFW